MSFGHPCLLKIVSLVDLDCAVARGDGNILITFGCFAALVTNRHLNVELLHVAVSSTDKCLFFGYVRNCEELFFIFDKAALNGFLLCCLNLTADRLHVPTEYSPNNLFRLVVAYHDFLPINTYQFCLFFRKFHVFYSSKVIHIFIQKGLAVFDFVNSDDTVVTSRCQHWFAHSPTKSVLI